jgi:ApaG protein
MLAYYAQTGHVTVTVRPVYLDARSYILNARFVFAYYVRIENDGMEDVQLLRRHWKISDSNGHVYEVEGEGVIGVQPVIEPGSAHEYSSYCVLETFHGSMEGTYLMERAHGDRFRAVIPRFSLKAASN